MRCPVRSKLDNLSDVLRINENEPGGKTVKYFERTRDGKQILRDVMSRYIPQEIVEATKQGFSAPDASWFKGESIDFVRRKLIEGRPLLYEYLDGAVAREIVQQHLDGRENGDSSFGHCLSRGVVAAGREGAEYDSVQPRPRLRDS